MGVPTSWGQFLSWCCCWCWCWCCWRRPPSIHQPSHTGAASDSACDADALEREPLAWGCAKYLLSSEATTMAICGVWGMGKSSFMKQMEKQMLLQAAGGGSASTHAMSEQEKLSLRRKARSQLICAWFNAWQYVDDDQIWAGLVVELVTTIEATLPIAQRLAVAWRYNLQERGEEVFTHLVLPVFLGSALVLGLTVFAVSQLLACLSCEHRAFTCISGLASGNLSAAGNSTAAAGQTLLSTTTTAAGLLQPANYTVQLANGSVTTVAVPLNGTNTTAITTLFKATAAPAACRDTLALWMSVLVGVLGGLLALLVALNRVHAFLKPMSEVLQEKLKYISLPDHKEKTGYQNEVIKDIKQLQAQLQATNGRCSSPGAWELLKLICQGCTCLCSCMYSCLFCCGPCLPCFSPTPLTASCPKLVVFIDDLDRVPPTKVVDVLEAVNLILTANNITSVIGADKGVIEEALKAHYKDHQMALQGNVFLEKIVQVSVNLSKPSKRGMELLLGSLQQPGPMWAPGWQVTTEPSPAGHDRNLPWEYFQEASARMLNPASYTSITPRQVKRFFNHYYLASLLLSVLPPHKGSRSSTAKAATEQWEGTLTRIKDRQVWLAERIGNADKAAAAAAKQDSQKERELQKHSQKLQELQQQLGVVQQHLSRKDSAATKDSAAAKDNAASDPAERQLLHWCFLFSKYPEAMALVQARHREGQQLQQKQAHADERVLQRQPHLQANAVRLLQLRAAAASRAEQLESELKKADADRQQHSMLAASKVTTGTPAEQAAAQAKEAASAREAALQKRTREQELQVAQRRIKLADIALQAYADAGASHNGGGGPDSAPDNGAAGDKAAGNEAASSLPAAAGSGTAASGPVVDELVEAADGQPGLVGLHNLGNTCYMSSVLQCLAHTVPLMQRWQDGTLIHNPKSVYVEEVVGAFASLMQTLWQPSLRSVKPHEFKAMVDKCFPQFTAGQQQDAHDFMKALLDALHEETNMRQDDWQDVRHQGSMVGRSLISDIFQGYHELAANQSLRFMDLRLPVPELQVQAVCTRVEWQQCLNEAREQDPEKLCLLRPLPEVLVVQLVRAKPGSKIQTQVDFPLVGWDLSPYVVGDVAPADASGTADATDAAAADDGTASTPLLYDCYATINHEGQSMHKGHYTACVQVPAGTAPGWYLFDDKDVKRMKQPPGEDYWAQAYILFYRRRAAAAGDNLD